MTRLKKLASGFSLIRTLAHAKNLDKAQPQSGFTLIRTLADAKNLDKTQPYNGFTLIELLVTISIMGILVAIVVVSYAEFNRRQILLQATRQIVQDLRLAQSLASNNQKPDLANCGGITCERLDGYIFQLTGGTYRIFANCYSGDFTFGCDSIKSVTLSETFGTNFIFSGFTMARFRVLRQGVKMTPAGQTTLTVSAFGKSQIIEVDAGGSIKIRGETP